MRKLNAFYSLTALQYFNLQFAFRLNENFNRFIRLASVLLPASKQIGMVNSGARFHSHINTAKKIIGGYTGVLPFAVYLKQFFAQHKKYGSRDRKNIALLCYCYFRTCKALPFADFEKDLLTAVFLCNSQPVELLQILAPTLHQSMLLPLADKLALVGLPLEHIFPFAQELSNAVDKTAFALSFLTKPRLFIRVRPGKEAVVFKKLEQANMTFEKVSENCLALPIGAKVEEVVKIDREVVIQDLSSQRVGEFFALATLLPRSSVWDCCAASGGKSIMVSDHYKSIQLTVSDIRETILHNLQQRLQNAGLPHYHRLVLDVANAKKVQALLGNTLFDLVLCDAPCSGSGTWSRTPEQLCFFKQSEIERYSNLQKAIALNTAAFIKPGGYLLYITCSVFAAENEAIVAFIEQQTNLQLIKMELIEGYRQRADTMFAALLKNPG